MLRTTYDIFILPPVAGEKNSYCFDINNRREVIGHSGKDPMFGVPTVWRKNKPYELICNNPVYRNHGRATSINDDSIICGSFAGAGGACFWKNGNFFQLKIPKEYRFSSAYCINGKNNIYGIIEKNIDKGNAVLWKNQEPEIIRINVDEICSRIISCNEKECLLGYTIGRKNDYFIIRSGKAEYLSEMIRREGEYFSINNKNIISGMIEDKGVMRAAIIDRGRVKFLISKEYSESKCYFTDMIGNSTGYFVKNNNKNAFLVKDNIFYDINKEFGNKNIHFENALCMNLRGDICCQGVVDGKKVAILLGVASKPKKTHLFV